MSPLEQRELVTAGAVLLVVYFIVRRSFASPEPVNPAGMALDEVEPRLTKSTRESMMGMFANEWRLRWQAQPSPESLALILAHSSLETNRWNSMYEWNPGFLTTRSGKYFFKGDREHRYAAYDTQAAGVDALLDWIWNCPTAFEALKDGDPLRYASELKRCGYYEGKEADYARGVQLLMAEYLPHVQAAMSRGFGVT